MKTLNTPCSPLMFLLLVALVALSTACTEAPFEREFRAYEGAAGDPDLVCLLHLLNDPSTDLERLDEDARLDRRAARSLLDHRDGPDHQPLTDDDNVFDDLAEINHVSWVGESTLKRLEAFANEWCEDTPEPLPLGRFGGVDFSIKEARAALDFLNHAAPEALMEALSVDAHTASRLMDARDFHALRPILRVDGVDEGIFSRLRDASSAGTPRP